MKLCTTFDDTSGKAGAASELDAFVHMLCNFHSKVLLLLLAWIKSLI